MAGLKHNFRELKIWQVAMKVAKMTYDVTSKLPVEEKFGLKSQMNRSAVSVPSNIAEGSGRGGNKEFQHFLNIAISSSFELETQLLLAKDIFDIEVELIIEQIHETQRMIAGFKKSLGA
ncbi:MAG: four helix bundle protein [Fluviicola sp.]|nr:four helix bundle protein [Fluviicola sp.]